MGVKVSGIIDTQTMLLNVDTTAKKRVRSMLIRRAYNIQDMARKMAPIDTGDLEKAIKVIGDGPASRDTLGRFTRVEIEVYIDMEAPVEGRPGKKMGDYAYEMHEHLTPYGRLQLGEKSRAKQAGSAGVMVGGGFLERAAEMFEKAIDKELLDIVRDL
jgi:hypothetical protein